MSLVYHKLNINTIDNTNNGLPDFEQSTMNTHCLLIHLRKGKDFYNLQGLTPKISFVKDDGTVVVSDVVSIDNEYRGDISYIVGPALLSEIGRYTVSLCLYDLEEYKIGTYTFIVNVTKAYYDPHEDGEIEATVSKEEKEKLNKALVEDNIKTINGQSIIGEGDIHIEGSGLSAGNGIVIVDDTISIDEEITATKEYVNSELSSKQDTLIAGDNIVIENNVISSTGGGEGTVKSVNEVEPDENGNITIAIPSSTSELTNDSGFITIEDIPEIPTKVSDLENDEGYITASDIPFIPTNTSDLVNDSGFITKTALDRYVKTVNGVAPSASGNVKITSVEVAEQLYSPTSVSNTDIYNFRTTTRSADITSGETQLLSIAGNCSEPIKVQESISTATTPVNRLSLTLDQETFIEEVESLVGVYVFTFNGTAWVKSSIEVDLVDFGITLNGTPIENDGITVEVIENKGIFSATYTIQEQPRLSFEIDDLDVWREKANTIIEELIGQLVSPDYSKSATFTFTYNGSSFDLVATMQGAIGVGEYNVDFNDYSIVVTQIGDFVNGDILVVQYRMLHYPDLEIARPTEFLATGINQYHKETMTLQNCDIDENGIIVDNVEGKAVIYCKAVGGLDTGYICYMDEGNAYKFGYSYAFPEVGTSIIESGTKITRFGTTTLIVNEPSTTYYFVVAIDNDDLDKICIHPKWSGTKDTVLESYRISSIELPLTDNEGTFLPFTEYGLASVKKDGTYYRDEIDLQRFVYIKRLLHQEYSKELLDELLENHTPCSYDTHHIFTILEEPIEIQLDELDNTYIANDFGTECYPNTYPVVSKSSYQENLVDKLRRNVLTVSAQSFTQEELQQIYANLGLVMGDDFEY